MFKLINNLLKVWARNSNIVVDTTPEGDFQAFCYGYPGHSVFGDTPDEAREKLITLLDKIDAADYVDVG